MKDALAEGERLKASETGAASSSAAPKGRSMKVGGYPIFAFVDADIQEEQASSSAARDEEVWMHYYFFVFVWNFFFVFISL